MCELSKLKKKYKKLKKKIPIQEWQDAAGTDKEL